MRMTNRRDFIRVCSVVLGAVFPVAPTPVNPQLARTAERVAGDFAGAVEGLAAAIQNGGENGLVASEGSPGLRSEISQIGQLLESTIKTAVSQAARAQNKAEEKTGSAKVLSVIAAVVMVVVAVVIAAVTFGAASGLIAAAVITASAIIGAAVAAAGQVTGEAKVVADEICSVLRRSVMALQNLKKAPEADKARVRRLALTDLTSAVGSLKGAVGSLSRISGACGADVRVISASCQRVDQTLKSLTAFLRRLRLSRGGDGQAMIEALERVQRAFGDATASLQFGSGQSK